MPKEIIVLINKYTEFQIRGAFLLFCLIQIATGDHIGYQKQERSLFGTLFNRLGALGGTVPKRQVSPQQPPKPQQLGPPPAPPRHPAQPEKPFRAETIFPR